MTLSRIHAPRQAGLGVRAVRVAAAAAVGAAAGLGGCKGDPRHAERVEKTTVTRDIPAVFRGTVGSEVTFRGIEPQLISGLGIVVGLRGTGGGMLDPRVVATMERELARGGVTRAASDPRAQVSPSEFLRDPNVAVVIVEAAIPPGAPEGMTFDVRVRALPNSGVMSLEGGTLWTTELRIGPATIFSGYKTRLIAEARGQVFINPFATPGGDSEDGVSRTVGRILGGGRVTEPLKIEMVLDNESHTRSLSIVNAINMRFPPGPGDDGPPASGRSGSSIALRIPARYREDPEVFLQLIRYLRIDQTMPKEHARRYAGAMQEAPELAMEITWCLRALGRESIEFLRPLYDHTNLSVRLAALQAGAGLDDALVVPHLQEMAARGPTGFRVAAIEMMGKMRANPRIDLLLRELASAPELSIRVAAYEALAERGDPSLERIAVGGTECDPAFFVDSVPARDPLVYVTQQGKPRIAIFGGLGGRSAVRLEKPLLLSAWSDRLMMSAESTASPVRVYYRDTRAPRGVQTEAPDDLVAFIRFLARRPTPEEPAPGLAFTYSQVVGALYEMSRQEVVAAAFATEQDRLQAAVAEAASLTAIADRPEGEEDAVARNAVVFQPQKAPDRPAGAEAPSPGTPPRKTWVVPLTPVKPQARSGE